jgi:folate-dependent phosphoribosylglycinamide formyltransferase PurN
MVFLDALAEEIGAQPDVIVLYGFMRILSDERRQNIWQIIEHPSIFAAQVYRVENLPTCTDNEDREHGTSVHFVTQ